QHFEVAILGTIVDEHDFPGHAEQRQQLTKSALELRDGFLFIEDGNHERKLRQRLHRPSRIPTSRTTNTQAARTAENGPRHTLTPSGRQVLPLTWVRASLRRHSLLSRACGQTVPPRPAEHRLLVGRG